MSDEHVGSDFNSRLGFLERQHEQLRLEVRALSAAQASLTTSVATISANVAHLTKTMDELVRSVGGRVAIGAGSGGIIAAIAYALLNQMGVR